MKSLTFPNCEIKQKRIKSICKHHEATLAALLFVTTITSHAKHATLYIYVYKKERQLTLFNRRQCCCVKESVEQALAMWPERLDSTRKHEAWPQP